jgi:methyl-accepting chemotaxis protein
VRAVRGAAGFAADQAKTGLTVVQGLDAMQADMKRMAERSQQTLTAAMEAERAVAEAQKGAEQVAAAAEQQSAATHEAQTAIGQQVQSLDQGQIAAGALAGLTEALHTGRADASAAGQIGAMAEELSATIQELSSAAAEITAAVEQIGRGCQLQAAATQQSSASLAQIERSAVLARENAELAASGVHQLAAALKVARASINGLTSGVRDALRDTDGSLGLIRALETIGRRIGKTVDIIAMVSIQTNMLAVSGLVEAARAGDAGRGFAVVSKDIRALAGEAAESADRIRDTLQGIADQIAAVRRVLEQTVMLAEAEVRKNQVIFEALDEVDGEVAALGAANAAILREAGDVLAAGAEIAAAARQIAAGAEQASAAARQAATASAEQAQGAEDLAAAIEELASLADELQQLDA